MNGEKTAIQIENLSLNETGKVFTLEGDLSKRIIGYTLNHIHHIQILIMILQMK